MNWSGSTGTWVNPSQTGETLIAKLHDERLALSEKMEKLKLFISYNGIYQTISDEQKELLDGQLFYMQQYEDVLLKRMKLLNQPQITYTHGTTS